MIELNQIVIILAKTMTEFATFSEEIALSFGSERKEAGRIFASDY